MKEEVMTVERYKGRFWAVYDGSGALVCVCVYRKGAREVARRLMTPETTGIGQVGKGDTR